MTDRDPVHTRVRPRTPEDVAAVADLLLRQQPLTRYPHRVPLPVPVEEFVARPGQIGAWVADDAAGEVVGHVGLTVVVDDEVGRVWSDALGLPVDVLGAVGALVVDPACARLGIGGALMDAAERHLTDRGLVPVLEVLALQTAALALYRERGWREVATMHPHWLPPDEEPVRFLVLSPERPAR